MGADRADEADARWAAKVARAERYELSKRREAAARFDLLQWMDEDLEKLRP